jgi:hypothetical protein
LSNVNAIEDYIKKKYIPASSALHIAVITAVKSNSFNFNVDHAKNNTISPIKLIDVPSVLVVYNAQMYYLSLKIHKPSKIF